jgi:hypothetical protein
MLTCEPIGTRRWLLGVATALAALIGPAAAAGQASAATIAVNKACYVDQNIRGAIQPAQMIVLGSGFVPGDTVLLDTSDGTTSGSGVANSAGDIAVSMNAPTPFLKHPEGYTSVLTAEDDSVSGVIKAETFIKSTELSVATVPPTAKPSKKVTWYFAGFLPGKEIYGHYLRHRKQVARARFGRAKGVCGVLKVRAHFFPGGHQRYHTYGLQIDNSKRYRKTSIPRIVTTLRSFTF